jgi:hypothetical protein
MKRVTAIPKLTGKKWSRVLADSTAEELAEKIRDDYDVEVEDVEEGDQEDASGAND